MTDRVEPSERSMRELVHELRSPLGGLEAMAEMLATTPLSPDQRRMVEALRASAAHLRAVADRTLGGNSAKRATVPAMIGDLIAAVADAATARSLAKDVSFAVDPGDVPPDMQIADPVELRQVLENLIDNAVRATEQGMIRLSLKRVGERLEISLRDTGIGISTEDATRLVAEGGAVAGRKGGAGLGLSVSAGLVARLGGHLTGGPNPESRGSEFRFDWPIERRKEKGARCLVVDDHPASRLVLTTILGAFGIPSREAATLEEAKQALGSGRFDAVLTDLCLGEEDGRDLVRHIASCAKATQPKIIVVSADDIGSDFDCAEWVDARIAKPVSVQAIANVMNALGLGGRARGEIAAA